MDNRTIIPGSEIQAKEYERSVFEDYRRMADITAGKKEEIESLLKGGKDNYPLIRAIIHENMNIYKHNNDFAEIAQLVQIYSVEADNDMENMIFDISPDLSELIYILRQLKYMLFRVEFDKITDGGDELCELIGRYKLSLAALDNMVGWCCNNQGKVYVTLVGIFLKHGMFEYAEYAMDCAETMNPGNESIKALKQKLECLKA